MYAIIETGGAQLKVSLGEKVVIPKLEAKPGEVINFPRVLFLSHDGKVEVGRPCLDNVKVEGEVLRSFRGRKVLYFRYQRRENYERKKGFRPELLEVKITGINVS